MGLDRGAHRLELVFDDGHLRQWWAHAEKRSPAELRRFEERVDALVEALRVDC
jgi:hypothetical protein